MASELVLATRSAAKAREVREILAGVVSVRLLTLEELQVPPDPVEDNVENHSSFLANAIAKARYFAQNTGRSVLADDSGLMVDALGGAPGVRTKRFAADHGITTGDVDEANNRLLLEKLAGVPVSKRGAAYVCAAACVHNDGRAIAAVGTYAGFIATAPRGTGGFGYDPLFLTADGERTFGELTAAEKHELSHRARAFRALAAHLK